VVEVAAVVAAGIPAVAAVVVAAVAATGKLPMFDCRLTILFNRQSAILN
jgi:hypothetical protein